LVSYISPLVQNRFSSGESVQEEKTVFFNLNSKLYMRIERVEGGMKFVYVLFLKANVAVIYLSKPPARRVWKGRDREFLNKFHNKIFMGHSETCL